MRTKIRKKKTARGIRWYVSTIADDGREEAHGGHGTRKEATAAAAALVTDSSRRRYVSPVPKLTLGAYLVNEWLPSRETADLSETTRDTDRTVIEAWVLPWIGEVPLQKLSARDLDRLYRELRTRGGRGGRPLSGKTARNAHVTVHKALHDAVRRGHLAVNVADAVDPPAREDSIERMAWTRDEVHAFLAVAAGDRLHAIWRIAIATGLRRGELVGLRWDDVDEGAIHVRRQVLVRPRAIQGKRRVYVRSTLKNRRARRVRIDDQTASEIRRWKVEQSRERLAFGAPWKTDGGLGVEGAWIVTEADGGVVHPDTLLGRWRRLGKAAGVRAIPLHGARHSYVELALSSGVRLDVVSRAIGHASAAFTADQYAHDSDEAAAEAAERIGTVLGESKGVTV